MLTILGDNADPGDPGDFGGWPTQARFWLEWEKHGARVAHPFARVWRRVGIKCP